MNGEKTTSLAALDDPIVLRQKAIKDIPAVVDSIVIETDDDLLRAAEIKKGIDVVEARINALFDPGIAEKYRAHHAAIAEKNELRNPVLLAKDAINEKITAYRRRRERERIEAERRIADEAAAAKKKAEDEEAERKRLADEKLREAAAKDAAGDRAGATAAVEEAARIESAPPVEVVRAPVVIPSAPPKLDGLRTLRIYDFTMVDPSKVAAKYMVPAMPDLKLISKIVAVLKERAEAEVGGITVFYTEKPVSTGRR